MNWKIVYSPRAHIDLQNIFNYIAYEVKSPENARGQVSRILANIDKLENMPKRNSLYDKEPWKSKGFRKLVVDKFLVFYLTMEDKNEVVILAIMYGGRNIEDIL